MPVILYAADDLIERSDYTANGNDAREGAFLEGAHAQILPLIGTIASGDLIASCQGSPSRKACWAFGIAATEGRDDP